MESQCGVHLRDIHPLHFAQYLTECGQQVPRTGLPDAKKIVGIYLSFSLKGTCRNDGGGGRLAIQMLCRGEHCRSERNAMTFAVWQVALLASVASITGI